MANTVLWNDPDTQQGVGNNTQVEATYLIDPATRKAFAVGSLSSALSPFGSNPAQTAAAGADTQYKFGTSGTTQFNHVAIQNNTGANIFYAFDVSTTGAGNAVYVLATGQTVFWDRACTILHFSSAAQQSFGGTTGITIEAFA